MREKKLPNISFLPLLLFGLLSFSLNTSKAYAGGGDEPVFTDSNGTSLNSNFQPENVQPTKAQPTNNLDLTDWSKWQTPTQNAQVVCREKDGNVVCISSLQSQNLRWTD